MGKEPIGFQTSLQQLCQGSPYLQVAPAWEGTVLQALGALQDEVHHQGGFRHRVGSGLDTWAGRAAGPEEWSWGEEDEGQGQRHGWNDTLS